MIKVCMILKQEWLLANYWGGGVAPPIAMALLLYRNGQRNNNAAIKLPEHPRTCMHAHVYRNVNPNYLDSGWCQYTETL
jgi:hypothetical protein